MADKISISVENSNPNVVNWEKQKSSMPFANSMIKNNDV